MATTAKMAREARTLKFAIRHRNRCRLCGRPRAFIRKFDMCRLCFRKLALEGKDYVVRDGDVIHFKFNV